MNKTRLLDQFMEMVHIESPSWHEGKMAAYCKQQLEDMGFHVTFDDANERTGSEVGNMFAFLPGNIGAASEENHIAFCAHMDTVDLCEGLKAVMEQRRLGDCCAENELMPGEDLDEMVDVIYSEGETILSADDKSGIAAIFEGIRSTIEADMPRPDLTVVLTTCEERSLLGSNSMRRDALQKGLPCFVLDSAGRPGVIITGAPCNHAFKAEFHGKAAHAGVEPEAGASAIEMAALAINKMKLGRLDECTTANIGKIDGGVAINIVAESCQLEGECRSIIDSRAEAQRASMQEAIDEAAEEMGGSVTVEWVKNYPAIHYTEEDPIVQHLVNAAKACGIAPRLEHTGGGADANIFASRGVQAITLGTGMTNFHSVDEYILVRDLENLASFVEAIVAEYA